MHRLPLEFANTHCAYCDGPLGRAMRASDRNRRITREQFLYGKCLICGSYTLVNPPSDMGIYYPNDYVPWRTRDELRSSHEAESYRLEFLTRHGAGPGMNILEIGPGDGLFASMAVDAGMNVRVIERTQKACDQLEKLLGVEAIATDNPAAALETLGELDAVIGWHVIEHLPSPGAFLDAAAKALRPGGTMVLAAPNPRSRSFSIMRGAWPHADAPRHLTLPDPSGISQRLASAMDVVELTDGDPGSRHWEGFAWHYLARRPSVPPRIDAGLALAGAVTGKVSNFIDRRPLTGAAYTLVLRRRSA